MAQRHIEAVRKRGHPFVTQVERTLHVQVTSGSARKDIIEIVESGVQVVSFLGNRGLLLAPAST